MVKIIFDFSRRGFSICGRFASSVTYLMVGAKQDSMTIDTSTPPESSLSLFFGGPGS